MYAENQLDAIKEALFKFQQENDTKAEVGVSMSYSSGQVSTVATTLTLIQTDIIDSFLLVSYSFMTRPLVREYLMVYWPSPLSRGMSQRVHSLTFFRLWALWASLPALG